MKPRRRRGYGRWGWDALGIAIFLVLVFPQALKYTKGLLFAGVFTGTVGVLMLLVFQFIAFNMPVFVPRGIIGLVILVVKLIGLSYAMASNPNYGFFVSFLGFTCGVGLCEEICSHLFKPAEHLIGLARLHHNNQRNGQVFSSEGWK